ncbi:MAG: UDP-N-acetylglucosamine 1-carboxyvinyltransferase [Alphaproteobacteria bacterium]|nr:UDP-N-acetylglucosamine 1-carboxyvinyltransferase [Alphaproteobacteria bacterium]
MESLKIVGGRALRGQIEIGGSKNATLPILAVSLLCPETLLLRNVPKLSDVSSMLHLVRHLGCTLQVEGKQLLLNTATITTEDAPYDIVRKMRTSILVLGPLLGRFGKARVSLPGGCAIGTRPIDLHLKGFRQMGAEISLEQGYISAVVPGRRLQGAEIELEFASVGATQNLMMAAVLADGVTCITRSAREPEIAQLADCLNSMGADVRGAGSTRIEIHGVQQLHEATYAIEVDRIQSGSYAMMVAASGGQAFLGGMNLEHLGQAREVLTHAGVEMTQYPDGVEVRAATLCPIDVVTAPYPGFPTDLQAQLMVLLSLADGRSTICEKIFENRFMHVPELQRMGADIQLEGDCAIINATPADERTHLGGAAVMATDLRASFCLIMLGLVAEGVTLVQRLYHLDRGYEDITTKLLALGADVKRGKVDAF